MLFRSWLLLGVKDLGVEAVHKGVSSRRRNLGRVTMMSIITCVNLTSSPCQTTTSTAAMVLLCPRIHFFEINDQPWYVTVLTI
jgi:hypothetical protein